MEPTRAFKLGFFSGITIGVAGGLILRIAYNHGYVNGVADESTRWAREIERGA